MARMGRYATVMLLALTTLSALPIAASAGQVLDTSLGLYQSPTYGYLLRWDTETWQVTATSSESGLDLLELQSRTTTVQLAAFAAFNGDPDRCLTDAAARIRAQDPQAFAPAHYEDGTAAEEHGDGYAYGAFLSGPGPASVVQVECRTLVQDRAVLQLTSVMASADYDAGADDGMYLIGNVALPRDAFMVRPEPADRVATNNTYSDIDTGLFLTLAVTEHTDAYADPSLPPPATATRWVAVDVALKNIGDVSVDIDALEMAGFDDLGVIVPVSSYAWTQATGSPDAAVQSLGPDQSLAARIVYQVDTGRQLIRVTCGCGANPGVPVEIGQVVPDPRDVFPPPPSVPCNLLGWQSPRIVADRTAAERVTLTATRLLGQDGVRIVLAVENSGAAPLTIAPENLWVVVDDRTPYRVGTLAWETDAGGSTAGPRELAAGERAIALLIFPVDEQPMSGIRLYYVGPDDGQLHDVAWFCVGCGCGGGSRPKIIIAY